MRKFQRRSRLARKSRHTGAIRVRRSRRFHSVPDNRGSGVQHRKHERDEMMNTVWRRGKHTVESEEISDDDLSAEQKSGEVNDQCECGDFLSESFGLEFGSTCPTCRPIEDDGVAEQ